VVYRSPVTNARDPARREQTQSLGSNRRGTKRRQDVPVGGRGRGAVIVLEGDQKIESDTSILLHSIFEPRAREGTVARNVTVLTPQSTFQRAFARRSS